MKALHPQLALAVGLPDHSLFESYYVGPNAAAVTRLREAAEEGVEPVLWLWGANGVGKTHLLQAACAAAHTRARQSVYLPLGQLQALGPEVLSGWEQCALVCIDDLDRLPREAPWERALFNLFNLLHERDGNCLVLAATGNPRALDIELADLRSRLSSGPVFQLQALPEAERWRALAVRAARRGLELPEETGKYLLRHYRRDVPALYRLLDRLDAESLAAQRRLTVPFVKLILARER